MERTSTEERHMDRSEITALAVKTCEDTSLSDTQKDRVLRELNAMLDAKDATS